MSLDNLVTKPTSSRPSVEIYAGYFDYFESDRIQVIGTKELTLFNMLSPNLKKERLDQISITGKHQGVIAYLAAYEYAQVEDILQKARGCAGWDISFRL